MSSLRNNKSVTNEGGGGGGEFVGRESDYALMNV